MDTSHLQEISNGPTSYASVAINQHRLESMPWIQNIQINMLLILHHVQYIYTPVVHLEAGLKRYPPC